MMAAPAGSESDLFKTHLVTLLAVYEHGPYPGVVIPRYEGPADEKTESILRSLDGLAKRVWRTEGGIEQVGVVGDARMRLDDEGVAIKDSSPSEHSQAGHILAARNTDSNEGFLDVAGLEPSGMMSLAQELQMLRSQVEDVARVCNAIARGDLSQKIGISVVEGSVMGQLKEVINTMVDKFGQFAEEITRVSLEIGTEGIFGGQAHIPEDLEGTWRDVTGAVNTLAVNLTDQVRSIAFVVNAVAVGDLRRQVDISQSRGEVWELGQRINGMIVRLRAIDSEVSRVVFDLVTQSGVPMGTQAYVPDIEGVWFDLVSNVNRLCSTVTDRMRAVDPTS